MDRKPRPNRRPEIDALPVDRPAALSHVGADGRARMVDVGKKPLTQRRAVAEGTVTVSAALARKIRENSLAKGNLLEVARLAGVLGAKRTDELIPLCHSLPLDHADVEARLVGRRVLLRAEARTNGRTGVEMEALTAVTIAALTVIDMGKSVDRGITIERVRLVEKSGGRSGHYVAPTPSSSSRSRS